LYTIQDSSSIIKKAKAIEGVVYITLIHLYCVCELYLK